MKKLTLIIFLITLTLLSCTSDKKFYRIGVSQCSEDIWRNWQNAELQMEANIQGNVELIFTTARDDSRRQTQQIDSLVACGIDLLIVAPNQLSSVTPAIDRAYNQHIPVIVFERKTDSQKYTAFVSADNYEMGHQMGEYIAKRLGGHGRVMEILGLKGSSPASDRHKGFADAISHYPDIQVTASLQGDWTEQTAYRIVKQNVSQLADVDLVFGHNDRTAIGARKAYEERGGAMPLFCGIDGLPGENGGIQQVRDSLLDASYIYPTRGDQLLQLALDILEGKTYQKEILMTSALVTRDNANVLLLESDEVMRQAQRLDKLQAKIGNYLQQIDQQRLIIILFVGIVLLLLLLAIGFWLYHRQQVRIAKERGRLEREQLDFYTRASHQLRTPLTLIEGPLNQLAQQPPLQQSGSEAGTLMGIVQRNTRQLSELINQMLDVQVGRQQPETTGNLTDQLTVTSTTATADEHDATRGNILLVDDNADIRAYLHTILHERYQLSEAANGEQGLALANELVPDLIVSDVMMPVMNGLEFCQRVKSGTATSHIPVILLTARALSQHQVEGYESGADAYITKPFRPEVLQARIDNLLKSRQRLKNLFAAQQPTAAGNTGSDKAPTREDAFVQRFCHVVEQNLADSDLSVETVGAELGLSRVQLYRKMKALTGQSPVELMRTLRLRKGRQLLETTDKTISEVAYEVGFSSPSYFAKCFKDEFGVNPSEL